MAVILIRTTIPDIDGMAADESVNDFVFNAPSTTDAAMTAVLNFYTSDGGTGHKVGEYFGLSASRAAPCVMQAYDISAHLDGSPHGSPIASGGFTLPGPTVGTSLPEQVAIVMSYHAAYGGAFETGPSGPIPTEARARVEGAPATHPGKPRPKSRLRGRIYLGPLNTDALNAAGRMGPLASGAVGSAATRLMTAALGWAVWSRRDAAVHNIIGGWTGDELGVQRRRKIKAGSKTTWSGG